MHFEEKRNWKAKMSEPLKVRIIRTKQLYVVTESVQGISGRDTWYAYFFTIFTRLLLYGIYCKYSDALFKWNIQFGRGVQDALQNQLKKKKSRLKEKEIRKMYQTNSNHKKAGVAILISNRL